MMKNRIRNAIKNFLFNARRLLGIEKQAVLLGEIRAQQIRSLGRIETLADAEFSVFSQWGEDGIISWLVDVIEPDVKRFVEFGVEDYRESNTRYMLIGRNWSGLVIDGSDQNINTIRQDSISYKYDFRSCSSFIDRDNINHLLASNGAGGHLGLLSVDIDGVDYWVLEAIQNSCDIIVVEYNDLFSGHAISVPYDKAFRRLQKHWSGMYWGASLDAFRYLLEPRGYCFVGTNSVGTNAFFVAARHQKAVGERLISFHAWPCKMREVRNKDGSLSLQSYAESKELIADLTVIDVTTGMERVIGELLS